MGYLCPQQIIEEQLLIEASAPVMEDLVEHGVFGYVTIDFMIFKNSKNPARGICFSGIKCYYDDFLSGYTLFKAMIQETYKMKYYLHIPNIEDLSQDKDRIDTLTTFFEDCKYNGVNYDVEKLSGSVFLPYNSIDTSIMGVLIIEDDYTTVLRTAHRTLRHLTGLESYDFSVESDARQNLVNLEKCLDHLRSMQKVSKVHNLSSKT